MTEWYSDREKKWLCDIKPEKEKGQGSKNNNWERYWERKRKREREWGWKGEINE